MLFCSSESYKRFTFINASPVISPPLSHQRETQSISTPVHLRQIVFECICNRRQQIGGGEYLHTTLGALVATWCCVGRQAGLTCVQAVPVKHVWNLSTMIRLGGTKSKSLTYGSIPDEHIPLARVWFRTECSWIYSRYPAATVDMIALCTMEERMLNKLRKCSLRVLRIPWDGSGPCSARRH